jgi:hypothetical protein
VNFWAALIFASLNQDKEDRKKVNTNEGKSYKDSVLELPDIYRDDRCVRTGKETLAS